MWRLLTHHLVWSSSSELILGSVLLYTWRMFERMFGSRKFGGCLAFLLAMSTALQVCVAVVCRATGASFHPSSGPWGLIFGLLACFFMDIPQSMPFTVFGVPLSDKMFLYILNLQLALSGLPGSAYTALIGLVLGFLYRWEALPFHRIRIPQVVSRCFGRVFSPLLSGSLFATLAGVDQQGRPVGARTFGSGRLGGAAPPVASRAPATHAGGYAMVDDAAAGDEPEGEILNDVGAYYTPAHMMPPLVAADPAAVAQLQAMGFPEDRARAALQAAHNDVTAATNRLLGM